MKPKRYYFATIGLISALLGCATSYHSSGFAGGFSDTQYAPDTFRVIFRGNGFTTPERAQDLALLRAAELTTENGFTCFAILNENDSAATSTITTPGYVNTTATGSGYSSGSFYFSPNGGTYAANSNATINASTSYLPPQTHVIYKPRTGLVFRCFAKPPDGIYVFDAQFLQRTLKKKYNIE